MFYYQTQTILHVQTINLNYAFFPQNFLKTDS